MQELWNLSESIGDVGRRGLTTGELSTLPVSSYEPRVSQPIYTVCGKASVALIVLVIRNGVLGTVLTCLVAYH